MNVLDILCTVFCCWWETALFTWLLNAFPHHLVWNNPGNDPWCFLYVATYSKCFMMITVNLFLPVAIVSFYLLTLYWWNVTETSFFLIQEWSQYSVRLHNEKHNRQIKWTPTSLHVLIILCENLGILTKWGKGGLHSAL